jgi:hypothetical protein
VGLWFGALGGAVAWLLHLVGCYAIAEFGCVGELGHVVWNGVSVVAWMCIGTTAVSLLLALVAMFVAFRLRPRTTPYDADREWLRSTADGGLLLSGFFAATILFESIPILFYLRC